MKEVLKLTETHEPCKDKDGEFVLISVENKKKELIPVAEVRFTNGMMIVLKRRE